VSDALHLGVEAPKVPNEKDGPPTKTADVTHREVHILDDATKQLLIRLVRKSDNTGAPGRGSALDWEAIWSTVESAPSEEMALGAAALAVEEAVAGPRVHSPSSLLARHRSHPPRVTRPYAGAARTARQALPEMPKHLRRAITGATWVRNLGIIIVLFAVWQLWGTGIAESHSQNQLRQQYAQLVRRDARSGVRQIPARPTPEARTAVFTEGALPGGVVGHIRIPAISVSDYFVEGVGEPQLQEGPGRYPGSGLPGQKGNLAIAGHRTTYGAPFFQLGRLRVGDLVIIDVPQGRATYRVSEPPFAVSPYDTAVLADFGDARLTLTTCNPPFFATTRLIVVAKLDKWAQTGSRIPLPALPVLTSQSAHAPAAAQDSHDASTIEARTPPVEGPPLKLGLAEEGGGWHLARLPVVVAVVVLLCALGAIYERMALIYAGRWRWLVMAPMWAAGLLALFRVLSLLLPADL
jgi:sortase A